MHYSRVKKYSVPHGKLHLTGAYLKNRIAINLDSAYALPSAFLSFLKLAVSFLSRCSNRSSLDLKLEVSGDENVSEKCVLLLVVHYIQI